jgi:hypothetical protein
MGEWELVLILLGAFIGAAGGSIVGITNGVGIPLARKGESRRWIGFSLVTTMILGVAAVAFGLTALCAGHGFGLPLGVIIIGVLVTMAAGHVRRQLRDSAPPSPPAISRHADPGTSHGDSPS